MKYWTDANGNDHVIKDMDLRHMRNIIKMFGHDLPDEADRKAHVKLVKKIAKELEYEDECDPKYGSGIIELQS